MMGLAFTIIGDVFSPAERGKYQGFFAATYGLASIFGPTLGGWLTDQVSWRATFYVNLPVGVIAIFAMYHYFPYWHPEGVHRRIDWAGVFSLIFCMVPLLLAFTWVTEYGWSAPRVDFLLVLAAVMLAAFLYSETRALEPLIPLSLFRDPVVSMSSMAVFILGMGMFGVIIYLPLFMQGVLGVSATQSGNLLTPLLLGSVAGSITTGQANLRLRTYKPSAIVGSVLIAVGMTLFARMDLFTTHAQVLRAMIIAGFGMGLLDAGLHRRGPECRAAQAHGSRHGFHHVLSPDREHGRRGHFRESVAEELSSGFCQGCSGRHSSRRRSSLSRIRCC